MHLLSWRWRIVSVATIFLGLLAAGMASEPAALRLIGTADKEYEHFTVRDGAIWLMGADGETRPVPLGIRWQLRGAMSEAANLANLSPDYRIRTRGRVPMEMGARIQTFAVVKVVAGEDAWSDGALNGAIGVIVWIVDGNAAWVCAEPIVLGHAEQPFACIAVRELSSQEQRGYPIVLLLKGNSFLPAKPVFADSVLNGALASMILENDEEAIRRIQAVPSVDGRSIRQRATLLHMACSVGRPTLIDALIERGSSLEVRDNESQTPLVWAAANGRRAAVDRLLSTLEKRHPASRRARDGYSLAVWNGHPEVAMALAEDGNRYKAEEVINCAAEQANTAVVTQILSRNGPRFRPRIEDEAVSAALLSGDPDIARALLSVGLRPNREWYGWPLITLAALSGSAETIDALMVAGARAEELGPGQVTPLMTAALAGDVPSVERLLQAGCNVENVDQHGLNALQVARAAGRKEVVARLQALVDERGQSPVASETVDTARWWGEPCFGRFGERVYSDIEVDVPPALVDSGETGKLAVLFDDSRSIFDRTFGETVHPLDLDRRDRELATQVARRWIAASLIVEKDGRPSAVSVVAGNFDYSKVHAARVIHRFRFSPAMDQGAAVRGRCILVIMGANDEILKSIRHYRTH